ncbi:MAG TPA: thrombospondin type 3 repeat-containing protein, partial [Kofleriaceae bacterium]|nr:thrombospondin type 3 repeat-containing protein [Kofleriaceae bacterium]
MKLLAAIVIAAIAGTAHAQEDVRQKPAISVERYTPPPGTVAYLGADDPDTLLAGTWAFSAAFDLIAKPIVLRELGGGAAVTAPVAWRLGLDLGAARGFGSRWQLGLAVPVLLQGGDRLRGIGLPGPGGDKALDRAAFGDLRVYGKARVAGDPGDPGVAATASIVIVLPTGDDGDFAGEEGTVVEWRIAGGWRGERTAFTLNAGARFRTAEVTLLSPARPNGDELVYAVAAERALHDHVWAIGELDGVLGDSIGAGTRGSSPIEARAGARVRLCDEWSVTAGGAAGLTPAEVGAPSWRAIVSLAWTDAPRGDFDGDGVPDRLDQCPRDPEDRDGFADEDGCPE